MNDESWGEHTIGVRSSVGHRKEIWLVMLLFEVLILEFLTVDGLSTGTLHGVMGQHVTRSANANRKQRNYGNLSEYLHFHG